LELKLNENIIQTDILPFADPGTAPSVTVNNSKIRVKIIRFGEERDYIFDTTNGKIESRHNNKKFVNVASLLASEEFADLRAFANTQRQALLSKKLDALIPPSGIIDPEGRGVDLSLESGRALLKPIQQDEVKVILLDGPAGVGKTSFIERMVFERCTDMTLPPIFHITSKGRRLSNLPDAMGKTASDLNAKFRAEHIPILARNNVLQVAIDGFDELVQPDGYGNAWEAMKDFVRQMGANGPLILAGRDTFFDQQGVKKQFDNQKVDLVTVRLREVTENEAQMWLLKCGWDLTQLQDADVVEFFKRGYTRRPFFLTQIAKFNDFANIPAELGSPQAILVDSLLNREAKILEPVLPSLSREAIKKALSGVFEEIAVDMADREIDTVNLGFVEFLAEYAFTEIANENERNALTKKIGSAPLLEKGNGNSDCKFPHSEIQNHFLARALVSALLNAEPFPSLRAAVYGGDSVEAFADVFRTLSEEDAETVLFELQRLIKQDRHTFRFTANVSALLIATLVRKLDVQKTVELSDLVTGDVRVFDELSPATLTNVTIPHFDVRSTDLSALRFVETGVALLIADESTRFGDTWPSVNAIQINSNGSIVTEYAKENIGNWLKEHSRSVLEYSNSDEVNSPLVKLFDRLCRRFVRQHYIRDNIRDDAYVLLSDKLWPVLRDLLTQEGYLLTTLRKDISGSGDNFYHMKYPEKLLSPGDDQAARRVRDLVIKRSASLTS
jgi:hypothetical protein